MVQILMLRPSTNGIVGHINWPTSFRQGKALLMLIIEDEASVRPACLAKNSYGHARGFTVTWTMESVLALSRTQHLFQCQLSLHQLEVFKQ